MAVADASRYTFPYEFPPIGPNLKAVAITPGIRLITHKPQESHVHRSHTQLKCLKVQAKVQPVCISTLWSSLRWFTKKGMSPVTEHSEPAYGQLAFLGTKKTHMKISTTGIPWAPVREKAAAAAVFAQQRGRSSIQARCCGCFYVNKDLGE
ncbi:hypothetical protein M5K25_024984 [Dendrobium thyrsiflorum]|uniref:Uncharacterized protein n=1 Tax=Dendrobium thyrsiflorum TaxID=117978 RepID=A0ABD0U806_DENTH